MSTVYMLSRAFTASDSDGWEHWIDHDPVSYHRTREGALAKIDILIEEELTRIEDLITANPHVEDVHWQNHKALARDNQLRAWEGSSLRTETITDLFVIEPLLLED